MTYTWFRFYNDAVNDPKVQRLSPFLFRFWINCLCLASANGGRLPDLVDVAFSQHLSQKQAEANLDALISAGLVDHTEAGLSPHNWDRRQFKSDTSTERVKRFRNASKALPETGPDTDSEQTIPESERNKVLNFVVGKSNGVKNGHTIQDPAERLNRFQKWLAEALGRDGYSIVGAAMDQNSPLHRRSLDLCKAKTKELGKGWPHQWGSA